MAKFSALLAKIDDCVRKVLNHHLGRSLMNFADTSSIIRATFSSAALVRQAGAGLTDDNGFPDVLSCEAPVCFS